MEGILDCLPSADRLTEHTLSDRDFRFISDLVYRRTGIVLSDRKREMLYRRLMRRTRACGLNTFSEYCALLKSNCANELPNFINAITTNLTSFYREAHHFEYIEKSFLPKHCLESGHNKELRIWSSACSTGEEPYSLAMTVADFFSERADNWDIKILATDLDTEVLDYARQGIYPEERVSSIPFEKSKRWLLRNENPDNDSIKIKPELSQAIYFKQLNLIESWPMKRHFDLIMCRNVLIYFDRETQEKLIDRYYHALRPGGILMLGHSETLSSSNVEFKQVGRTTFMKPREGE